MGAGLLALLGVAAALWLNRPEPIRIDEASLCPIPAPTGVHAVLVNRSDPLNEQQERRVRELLDAAVAEAPAGTRVALYVSETDDVRSLAPKLALCSPGTEPNLLYRRPAELRPRFEQAFRETIAATQAALVQPVQRNTSPVMESIRAVCTDAFGAVPTGITLRLTVIGDMIQYSPLANHNRDRDFDALLQGRRLDPVVADCKGAQVDIAYVLRPSRRFVPSPQNAAHQRFWDGFFRRMNARPRSIEAV